MYSCPQRLCVCSMPLACLIMFDLHNWCSDTVRSWILDYVTFFKKMMQTCNFALQDGRLLDADSHILYSPLPCRVPLPGFEGLRFCVSQYTDKERSLLRNLCHVLGAVCKEKLTKRITHLLCKYATGNKYEAACKWGIHPVRCEWLYECVRKVRISGTSMTFYYHNAYSGSHLGGI